MDRNTFVRIVQSFADQKCDIDDAKGELTAIIRGDIYSVTCFNRGGDLFCREDGVEYTPGQWITRRLAKLDLLAQRILEYLPEDPRLIPVEADYTDTIEHDPTEVAKHVPDALATLQSAVEDKVGGMTHVVYLTADAGEGKTSLIEALARKQAQRLLDKEPARLLLPISLGGQALIRLDDIIVGTLTNRLRFPFYYIESVLELVKLDLIVLALDGFEEMFVETQAGGVSSLGTLVSQLASSGRIVCSARTAYYRYTNMDAQARLRDCLRGTEVSFSELHLQLWRRTQFMSFAQHLPLTAAEAEDVYQAIAGTMSESHPLLTRAVLARRFLEEYVHVDDQEEFLAFLKEAKGEQYFEQFVTALLTREANQKWLGRESPARPLLTVDEHHTLLMRIAEEMWLNGVDGLATETLQLIAEVVAQDELKKPTDIVRQVVDRIQHHPFLRQIGGAMMWRFDHEDFRNFYVGRLIGSALSALQQNARELRCLLEVGPLPMISARVGVVKTEALGISGDWPKHLSALAEAGSRSSHLRENVGRLALMLLCVAPPEEECTLAHLLVTGATPPGLTVQDVRFIDCVFEGANFSGAKLIDVVFSHCEMTDICLSRGAPSEYSAQLLETNLPSKLTIVSDDGRERREYFAPMEIESQFNQLGFQLASQHVAGETVIEEEDESIELTFRALRIFQRATAVNEYTIKTRLGTKWPTFKSDVLPALLIAGVLMETDYRGQGSQRRYRVGTQFDRAGCARAQCRGSFERFLEILVPTPNS